MSNKVRQIYEVFDNASQYLARQKVEIDKSRINELLSNLYSPGPSMQYIFDITIRKFEYVSNSVTTLFGENPKTFTVNDFVDRIHSDDMKHFVRCEEIAGHFLFKLIPKEEIINYKISYQLRLKDVNGHYKLFLHQAIAFTMDENSKLASSFANHSDISHITTTNNGKVSFIHIKGGKSYYNITSIEDLEKHNNTTSNISQRELEILGLLAEGLSSKEIGDHLYISYETVRTHRNNILRKTKFKTLTQTIAYYIREGLI